MDNFIKHGVCRIVPHRLTYHIIFKNGAVVKVKRTNTDDFIAFLAGLARERGSHPRVKDNVVFLFGYFHGKQVP